MINDTEAAARRKSLRRGAIAAAAYVAFTAFFAYFPFDGASLSGDPGSKIDAISATVYFSMLIPVTIITASAGPIVHHFRRLKSTPLQQAPTPALP